jgi:hypothetical protein
MTGEDKAWEDYQNKFSDFYDDPDCFSPLQSFFFTLHANVVNQDQAA